MPHDDILAEIGADWKLQTIDHERMKARLAKQQRRIRRRLAVKMLGTAVALLAGICFLFLVVTEGTLAFGLAGIILIATLPLMVMEVLATRRLTKISVTNSPEGALHAEREQALASLRLLWAPRAVALAFSIGTGGLIVLHAMGEASRADTIFVAPIWIVTALIAWLWQARRARRLRTQISRCDLLLEEMREF
jgi:Flp pilus assembly protein TadB